MLVYSQRKKLEQLFRQWAKVNGVAMSPANVIAWLHTNGMINKDKVVDFLAEHDTVVKSVTPAGVDWKDWEEFWA